MTLVRCGACSRHVRPSESACPFCRARRVAPIAAGALVAATLGASACAVYGGPPPAPNPPRTADTEMRAAYDRCDAASESQQAEARCWRLFLADYESIAPPAMRARAVTRLRATIGTDPGRGGNVYGGRPPPPERTMLPLEIGDAGDGTLREDAGKP